MMAKYYKITEKELSALKDVADTMDGMSGCEDQGFNDEADRGTKAINAIMKRAGLQRIKDEYEQIVVKI
jgi:hypothetical protein